MALVYRAVLRDSDGSITRSVEALSLEWLREKQLIDEDFQLEAGLSTPLPRGEHPAWLQHQYAEGLRQGEGGMHRLRLVEESSRGRWTTSVVWRRATLAPRVTSSKPLPLASSSGGSETADEDAWVWLDLEHEPSGGRPLRRPGSPRLIRSLMAAGEAYDASLPLTAESLTITHGHIAELVGYITDQDRHVPVVVFAFDGTRAYDQAELARRLARDLAGVAAVFVLADAPTTQALSAALPAGLEVYGGALRTYLPGAGSEGDIANRHRLLGRVSLAALGPRAFPALKDQVLQLSTRRPAPVDKFAGRLAVTPAHDVALQHSRSGGPNDGLLEWLSRQVDRMRGTKTGRDSQNVFSDIDEARSALTAEVDGLLARVGSTAGAASSEATVTDETAREFQRRLEVSDQERTLLDSLFGQASAELAVATASVRALREDRDYLELELAERLRDNDKIRRRARWLRERFAANGQPERAPVDDDVFVVPEAVAEVVALARQRLKHVVIGPTDADAAELDVHSGASLYAAKTWDALLALDAFAAARLAGEFAGNFRAWCLETDDGEVAVSAQAVAMGESETVANTPALRRRREFPVLASIDPQRRQYMPAHIKLIKRGEAAPRLHFFDDCAGPTGTIHVGYIGEHLPTARFA